MSPGSTSLSIFKYVIKYLKVIIRYPLLISRYREARKQITQDRLQSRMKFTCLDFIYCLTEVLHDL